MNHDEAIDELVAVAALLGETSRFIRESSLADDKTPLQNSMALKRYTSSEAFLERQFDVVVFGDLNDFKNLNDTYGHDAGDAAIREVGNRIKETIMASPGLASAYRQSGDEFVILLRQENITEFLEKVEEFASIKFSYEKSELEAKMSFGLAIGDEVTDFPELLRRAETACGAAKLDGDGKCVEWTDEVQTKAPLARRRKCNSCGTTNSCSIPAESTKRDLVCCSCCGESF